MPDEKNLRDEFAIGAMMGDWASSLGRFDEDGVREHLEERARLYYRMADAMMEVRGGNLRQFKRRDEQERP